jgi:hypothetical protein
MLSAPMMPPDGSRKLNEGRTAMAIGKFRFALKSLLSLAVAQWQGRHARLAGLPRPNLRHDDTIYLHTLADSMYFREAKQYG